MNRQMPTNSAIDQILSRDPNYTVPVWCVNCTYKGTISIPKGKEKPHLSDCPRCECHTLRSGL